MNLSTDYPPLPHQLLNKTTKFIFNFHPIPKMPIDVMNFNSACYLNSTGRSRKRARVCGFCFWCEFYFKNSQNTYRIYLNKRRPQLSAAQGWKGNECHPQISSTSAVWHLFEYFHKMHYKKCTVITANAILSQQWEFILINSDVFQFKVSISRRSFI